MGGTLFIAWTVVGAAALTLAAVHGLVWLLNRPIARIEFGMMQAGTAAEYAAWVRWLHVPLFFLTEGLVLFIRVRRQPGGASRAPRGW